MQRDSDIQLDGLAGQSGEFRLSRLVAPSTSARTKLPITERLRVAGKFLFEGDVKFYVKGVSYGAFRPDAAKREYQNAAQIDRDFGHGSTELAPRCGLSPRTPRNGRLVCRAIRRLSARPAKASAGHQGAD